MNNRDINVEELTKNFRVSFDKAGLTIYVIPKENAVPLTSGLSYPFNNEDVQLYGTKVILHLPCSGAVYGRYLIQNGDYVEGLYLVIIDTECDIGVSWHEEGLSTKIHVKPSESLIVIVRLMRLRARKTKPNSYAARIMRILNLSGKFLYSSANHEIQVFGIGKALTLQSLSLSTCVNDFSIKQWRLTFNKCGFVTEVVNDRDTITLLIIGVNSIVISRYFPSLNKWYELGKVSGFNNYLVILKSEV